MTPIEALKLAYRKHWLNDESIGWEELGDILRDVLCEEMGDEVFQNWLCDQLAKSERRVAFLDGDVGQSALGPPTTMTLGLPRDSAENPSAIQSQVRWFVGDVSPRGRMLPLVVGAARLVGRALNVGAKIVVMDTTGLVNQLHGGVALKHALVNQLQPTTLFAFVRGNELEPILAPLRCLPLLRVIELPVSDVVQRRDVRTRQAHRASAFRNYFAGAGEVRLPLRGRAVFGGQALAPRRLLALQDAEGFTQALGVILGVEGSDDVLSICTPLCDIDTVACVELGAIGVDPHSGREYRPARKP